MAVSKASARAITPAAKGAMAIGSGTNAASILTVGSDNQVLTADSTQTTGVKWATASSTPTFVGCRVSQSSVTSISHQTWTALTYDTESFDSDGFHSNTTNNSRLTIPTGKGGYYLCVANATIDNSSTSVVKNQQFYINGNVEGVPYIRVGGIGYDAATISSIFYLNAGDYIQHYIWHNAGSNQNSQWASFQITLLGA